MPLVYLASGTTLRAEKNWFGEGRNIVFSFQPNSNMSLNPTIGNTDIEDPQNIIYIFTDSYSVHHTKVSKDFAEKMHIQIPRGKNR